MAWPFGLALVEGLLSSSSLVMVDLRGVDPDVDGGSVNFLLVSVGS